MSEIQTQLSNLDEGSEELKGKVQKWVEKGGRIIWKGIPFLAKSGARYALGESGLEELKDLLNTNIEDDLVNIAGKLAEKAVDEHHSKKQSIKEFKKLMEEAVALIPQTDTNLKPPLFIFIDELDRCRPTYAIELLENIKHLFSVPGVVFILATDSDQLGHSIRSVYGQGIDADAYIRRFIDQTYRLPEPSHEQFAEMLFRKLNMKSIWNDDKVFVGITNMTVPVIFANCSIMFRLSLREQEQCASKIRAILLNFKDHTVHFIFLCYLLMTQIKLTEQYSQFHKGLIPSKRLWEKIAMHIGQIRVPITISTVSKVASIYFNQLDNEEDLNRRVAELNRMDDRMSNEQREEFHRLWAIAKTYDDCKRHVEFAELAAQLD